jgi:hypothetical protein
MSWSIRLLCLAVVFFIVCLACGITLALAPSVYEFTVDDKIALSVEVGDSTECLLHTCTYLYGDNVQKRETKCQLMCSDAVYQETGVCGGIGCGCIKRCKDYVQKYRAVGVYTLRTEKKGKTRVQNVTSYSKFIYANQDDALAHPFSRETLGKSGWFPTDSEKDDNTFDMKDMTWYTPESTKRYKNDLSICTSVFGGASAAIFIGFAVLLKTGRIKNPLE